MKATLLIVIYSLSFAASNGGYGGTGFSTAVNTETLIDLPQTAKSGGHGGMGFRITEYFESLDANIKSKSVINLPKSIKIDVDRDFISPIDRWTLKTKQRDLLAKDIETIWNYDDMKININDSSNSFTEKEINTMGFELKDF